MQSVVERVDLDGLSIAAVEPRGEVDRGLDRDDRLDVQLVEEIGERIRFGVVEGRAAGHLTPLRG
jgi:hypothetical protein